MTNNTIKNIRIISSIKKLIDNKQWKCIIDDCPNHAINSHLLQKNGILDNISENGHVIEMKSTDVFNWSSSELPLSLTKVGINKAFSLPLFCSKHDTMLFHPIENKNLDLTSYKNQLLFSYRVVCAEIRKKEMTIEYCNRLQESPVIAKIFQNSIVDSLVFGNIIGREELVRYKNAIELEIDKPSDQFLFNTYSYPLIKVYCSAVFSPGEIYEQLAILNQPLNEVFIHLIPHNNRLNIIIGYHKKHSSNWIKEYIEKWKKLTLEEFEKEITSLFAARIENWGMSPKIYDNIPKSIQQMLIKYSTDNSFNHSENQTVEFNIFENNNYGT